VKYLFYISLVAYFYAFSPQAFAAEDYERVVVTDDQFFIKKGETLDVPLDGWKSVKKLIIAAEGVRKDAMFEVHVNDDVKGTIYVPGKDPEYVVTVAETANSIQFKHISGATVRVLKVEAIMSKTSLSQPWWDNSQYTGDYSLATQISKDFINVARELYEFADAEENERFLLPIKVAAGRTFAYASASGDLSKRVGRSLKALIAQVENADPFIDKILLIDVSFDKAVRFLTLRARLKELMD